MQARIARVHLARVIKGHQRIERLAAKASTPPLLKREIDTALRELNLLTDKLAVLFDGARVDLETIET